MEKATFGYFDSELRDILGEKLLEYRYLINEISQRHNDVNIKAGFHGCNFPLAGGLLRIKLEGELNHLELAVNEFFEELGVPDLLYNSFGIIDKFLDLVMPGKRIKELTTKSAYSIMKKVYDAKEIGLDQLVGNVSVRR